MEYIIEFTEKHSESALALIGHLRGLGIDVDGVYGVRRPTAGLACIVASLVTQTDWDAVERYPDVLQFMPNVVAEASDPLSGCDEPDSELLPPLVGCDEEEDADD